MDNLILETIIGLVFILGSFAGLVSTLTEIVSRFIGLRGEYLLRGIRTLVDGPGDFKLGWYEILGNTGKARKMAGTASAIKPAKDAIGPNRANYGKTALGTIDREKPADENPFITKVMAHALIRVTADKGSAPSEAGNDKLANKDRRKVPSYVSSRSFARAVVDLIVPNSSGVTTMTSIRDALDAKNPDQATAGQDASEIAIPEPLKQALRALADESGDDIAKFRENIAHWYDDQMARVSGWYKRHVRWISLGLGVALVIALNLNVLNIARSIYTDQALRGSVVTQATQASRCADDDPAACLRRLRSELTTVRGAGLPVGWTKVPICEAKDRHCTWFQQRGFWGPPGRTALLQVADFVLLLFGWGLMVIALLPGARFWFDALGRLGSLRSTGPKPSTA